jgi:hypothetical protein
VAGADSSTGAGLSTGAGVTISEEAEAVSVTVAGVSAKTGFVASSVGDHSASVGVNSGATLWKLASAGSTLQDGNEAVRIGMARIPTTAASQIAWRTEAGRFRVSDVAIPAIARIRAALMVRSARAARTDTACVG